MKTKHRCVEFTVCASHCSQGCGDSSVGDGFHRSAQRMMKWALVMVSPGARLHVTQGAQQVNFTEPTLTLHRRVQLVPTVGCAQRPLPPVPQGSPVLPLDPADLSHHTATYWVALAGNHKTPPSPSQPPVLSPWRNTRVECNVPTEAIWILCWFVKLLLWLEHLF